MCRWSVCARTWALIGVAAVVAGVIGVALAQEQPREARPASVVPPAARPAQQHPAPEPGEPARPPKPQRTPEPAAPPQPPDAPRPPKLEPPLRIEVTIYQLDLKTESATALDAAALAKQGATLADMDKVLNGLGRVSVLYRADQAVLPLDHTQMEISANVPYVSGVATTSEGKRAANINRQNLGAKLSVIGRPVDTEGRHQVLMNVEAQFTGMGTSSLESSPDVTAPIFREVHQTYGGFLDYGKPVVLLTVDGATNAATKADGVTAYITRIVFYPI